MSSSSTNHRITLGLLGLFLGPTTALAEGVIQDNSFLIEEAYNQEDGVVQHITTFQQDLRSAAWNSAFTQEWPAFGLRHQLSFTVPMLHDAAPNTGIGDLKFDYRYQAIGDGQSQLAFAPRVSLIVPTGSQAAGFGDGSFAGQINMPVSFVAQQFLVAHANAGITIGDSTGGMTGPQWEVNYGGSLVWLTHPRLNFMVEVAAAHVGGSTPDRGTDTVFVSPGVRAAFDVGSLQVVPGLAVPVGMADAGGDVSAFLYLSLEHPFIN